MGFEFFLLITLLILFYIGYFVFFFSVVLKRNKKKRCLKLFIEIIKTLYEKKLSVEESIIQLQKDYNKLYSDRRCECEYKLIDLLNMIIYYLDSKSLPMIEKDIFEEKDIKDIRDFIYNIINTIYLNKPFSSLPEKEASILNNIKISLNTHNSEMGNELLIQLANEIETKENKLIKEQKTSQISILISIIGVVLTVVFGILSFV